MKLIDEFLPNYEFTEFHEIQIQAPAEIVYQKVLDLDLNSSKMIGNLFKLRQLPALFSFKKKTSRKIRPDIRRP